MTIRILIAITLIAIMVGCNTNHMIEETPEIKTYIKGWADSWVFCKDWERDTFGTDESIQIFIEYFDVPILGSRQILTEPFNYSQFTEYHRGAVDAFRFMIRNLHTNAPEHH